MATKGDRDQPGRWKGEEVEDQPGDEAERAAARAEGNAPVRADAELERAWDGDEAQPREAPPAGQRESGVLSPEEKMAEAAEDHSARRQAGERPPRGEL